METPAEAPTGPSQDPGQDAPSIHVARLMLPFPWSTLAQVVVVNVKGEDLVILGNFHTQVLFPKGPMDMTMDTLRPRLSRLLGTQLVCSASSNPMLLAELKAADVVDKNAARVKLVSLGVMERVLIAAGKRVDHVALIISTYKSVASPSTRLKTPETLAPTTSLSDDSATSSDVTNDLAPDARQDPTAHTTTLSASLTAVMKAAMALMKGSKQSPLPSSGHVSMLNKRFCEDGDNTSCSFRDWPTNLPELAFPPKTLKDDYSIQALMPGFREDKGIPCGQELATFRVWCTTPVHLGRGVAYADPVVTITHEGCEDVIKGFLGYNMKVLGVPLHQLSTSLAEDPHKVASYCSFLVARSVAKTTLTKHVSVIRKLLAWRASLAQPASQHVRLQAVISWVDTLQKQCHHAALPSKSALQRTNLPHAKEFPAFQLKVEAHADKWLADDIERWGKMYRKKTAVACQDAALLALMAGYLPPPRLAAIRSSCHPDGVQAFGGCMDPDCRHGNACQGNTLQWAGGSNNSKLTISFIHHKNESRWDYLPIQFTIGASLAERLMPHIKEGWRLLAAKGQRQLFVHPNSGLGLTAVNLSQWFQQLLATHQASFKCTPNQLRHIFVDERCSAEAVSGPKGVGAARIMGNSVERWAISYDRNLHTREVQAAADAMEVWREELLALVED